MKRHALMAHAHAIDAVMQLHALGQMDVGGGKAHAGADVIAADDRAGDPPPVAQHIGGVAHVALGQQFAHPGGGKHLVVGALRRHDGDAETQFLPQGLERVGRALAALAEEEMEADDDMLDREFTDQPVADEGARGQIDEGLFERAV